LNYNSLKNILITGFYPKLSLEKILNNEYYIPLVSFCDIPLSEINEHSQDYGKYLIGLDKEKWGKNNNINPVHYIICENNNELYNDLNNSINQDLLEKIYGKNKTIRNRKEELISLTLLDNILGYLKEEKGNIIKNGKVIRKNKMFYYEREWRYIPKVEYDVIGRKSIILPKFLLLERKTNIKQLKGTATEIPKEDTKLKDGYNNRLKENHVLKFSPTDVKYIIVEKERQIPRFINYLSKLNQFGGNANITIEDKKLLFSRLMSLNNIKNDF